MGWLVGLSVPPEELGYHLSLNAGRGHKIRRIVMKRRTLRDALLEIRQENEEVFSEKYLVNHLFEDAKYFLETAKEYEKTNVLISRRYVRATVISAFAGLEALVNTFCQIMSEHGDLELHERAFVQEQRIELSDEGYFEIRGQRFSSLDEKVRFLFWHFQGLSVSAEDTIWKAFVNAKKLRNNIVHPRPKEISYSAQTVTAARVCLMAVFKVAGLFGWREETSQETSKQE